MAAMVAGTDNRGRNDHGNGDRADARSTTYRTDQGDQTRRVRDRRAGDRPRIMPGGEPGTPGGAGAQPGDGRDEGSRTLRRVALWFFHHSGRSLEAAREATATDPLIVAAVGHQEARKIAHRSYADMIDPELTGNFAADELINAVNSRDGR